MDQAPGGALPNLYQEILRIRVLFLRIKATWKPDHPGLLLQNFHRQWLKMTSPQPTLNMHQLGGTTRWSHP